MIDGKSSQEVLDLFDAYRKNHPVIYLSRFMKFAGLGQTVWSTSGRDKTQKTVDRLLSHHLETRGLVRRHLRPDVGMADVVYEVPKPKPSFKPNPSPVKCWVDPSLATWTPEDGERVRAKEVERRRQWQIAREREMAEERRSVRGMK